MKTAEEIDDIATDIAVMRGTQERRDAIKKLILDLQGREIKMPSEEEITIFSQEKAITEAPIARSVAKHYYEQGANWMKEQIIKMNK